MDDPSLRGRLSVGLQSAIKRRDKLATSAIRSALSAIANAEAVGGTPVTGRGGRIAGSVEGLGAGEVRRKELTEADVTRIVEAEAAALVEAADGYEELGRGGHAAGLRHQAEVLRSFV